MCSVISESAVLNTEEQSFVGTRGRYRAATGCTAACEAALRHYNATADSGYSTTVATWISAILKRDTRDGDGGVDDVEGFAQPTAAVEYGGARHAHDGERRHITDCNGGFIVSASAHD